MLAIALGPASFALALASVLLVWIVVGWISRAIDKRSNTGLIERDPRPSLARRLFGWLVSR